MTTELIRVNLNDKIMVKLTDLGKEIYYHQFDDAINAGAKIKPHFPKEDANGYTQFQLWDFIHLYGQHIGMARPNVIEPIDIVLVEWSSNTITYEPQMGE